MTGLIRSEAWRPVALLEVEPDLGAGLTPVEFESARAAVVVPSEVVARGPWQPPTHGEPGAVGFLLLSGLMVRELRLGSLSSFAELLGPGDLLRPWQEESEGGLIPWTSSWRVLEEASVATLGSGVSRLAGRWPALAGGLTTRAMQRTRRQSVAAMIPTLVRIQDRLVVLFMHLAERWGQVTPDGIVLHLPLTHELIAGLSGGRRPTVTTALGALGARGVITRRDEREWLLGPAIHGELESICSGRMPELGDRKVLAG